MSQHVFSPVGALLFPSSLSYLYFPPQVASSGGDGGKGLKTGKGK